MHVLLHMSRRKQTSEWTWALGMIACFGLFVYAVWSPQADKLVEKQIQAEYGEIIKKRAVPAVRDSIPGAGYHNHADDFLLYEREMPPPDTVQAGDTVSMPVYRDRNDFDDHAHFGMPGNEVREEIGNWVTALLEWSQTIVTGLGGWVALYITWRKAKKGDKGGDSAG